MKDWRAALFALKNRVTSLSSIDGITAALGYTPQPVIEEVAISAVAVSRVVRGTATDKGSPASTITAGGLVGITKSGAGTVSQPAISAVNATGFATNIAAWINTGGNLALIPGSSCVDNLNATFDVTLALGDAGNDLVFDSNDPDFSWTQTTAGSDATGRFTLSGKPLGFKAKDTDTGFVYELIDPDNYDSEAGWQFVSNPLFGYSNGQSVTSVTPVAITGCTLTVEDGTFYQVEIWIAVDNTTVSNGEISTTGTAVFTSVLLRQGFINDGSLDIGQKGRPTTFEAVTVPSEELVRFTGVIQITTPGTIILNALSVNGPDDAFVLDEVRMALTPIGTA